MRANKAGDIACLFLVAVYFAYLEYELRCIQHRNSSPAWRAPTSKTL